MPDPDALLEGISARLIDAPHRRVGVLERSGDAASADPDATIVFVHGDVAPALLWQEMMLDLPSDLRVIAVDLRGAADRARATDGSDAGAVLDVSAAVEDVRAVLDAVGIATAHLVGWSTGGAVAVQYASESPVLSLTLQAPRSEDVDTAGLADSDHTPPVLWIHGDDDRAAASPMREALAAYTRAGGDVTEVALEGVDGVPHQERPSAFRRALLERTGYLGHHQDPAPPTEAIIIPSSN